LLKLDKEELQVLSLDEDRSKKIFLYKKKQ
jgi:hypothetical protein